MQDVCSTCLSQNRSLKSLDLLRKEINLEWLQVDFICPSSELCWECVQHLRHADRFRKRARDAQSALKAARQLCSDQSVMPLRTLSTLGVSDTCQEKFTEWDTSCILQRIKQNKHISLSNKPFSEREIERYQIDIVKADNLKTIPSVEQTIKDMIEKLMSTHSHNVTKKFVKLFSIVEVIDSHFDSTEPNVEPEEPQAKKKKHLTYEMESEMDPDYNIMEPIIDIMEPIAEITEPIVDGTEPVGDMIGSNNDISDKADASYDSNQSKSWPVLTVGDPSMNLSKIQTKTTINFLSNMVSAEDTNMSTKRKQQKIILQAINTPGVAKNSQISETSPLPHNSQASKSTTVTNKSLTVGTIRDGQLVFMKPVKPADVCVLPVKSVTSESYCNTPIKIAPKPNVNFTKKPEVKLKSRKKTANPDVPYTIRHLCVEEMLRNREIDSNEPSYLLSPFKCESCIQSFTTNDGYNAHIELNHSESSGPFMCSICSTRFKREKSLKLHYKAHRLYYKCCECAFRHCNEQVMSKHVKDMHQGIKCQFCDLYVMSQSQLTEHVLEHHMSPKELRYYRQPQPPRQPPQAQPQCALCDKKFQYPSQLRLHWRSHPELVVSGMPYNYNAVRQPRLAGGALHKRQPQPYVCDQCGYGTVSRAALVQHMAGTHGYGALISCKDLFNALHN